MIVLKLISFWDSDSSSIACFPIQLITALINCWVYVLLHLRSAALCSSTWNWSRSFEFELIHQTTFPISDMKQFTTNQTSNGVYRKIHLPVVLLNEMLLLFSIIVHCIVAGCTHRRNIAIWFSAHTWRPFPSLCARAFRVGPAELGHAYTYLRAPHYCSRYRPPTMFYIRKYPLTWIILPPSTQFRHLSHFFQVSPDIM